MPDVRNRGSQLRVRAIFPGFELRVKLIPLALPSWTAQQNSKVTVIPLNSFQRLIASRCLPLCESGRHPYNERRHFTRCLKLAPDSPLFHHRVPLPSPFTADYAKTILRRPPPPQTYFELRARN